MAGVEAERENNKKIQNKTIKCAEWIKGAFVKLRKCGKELRENKI